MRMRDGIAAWLAMLAFVPVAMADDQAAENKDQPQAPAVQQADQPDQPDADVQNREQDQANKADQANTGDNKMQESMAACLALANHAEIELAKVAMDKTQNEKVRALAQQMLDDHTAVAEKLKPFMPRVNTSADQQADQAANDTTAELKQWAEKNHDPMQKLMQKIAKNELAMTKDVLMRYEGQDFDMGYLGQQILAHTQMLAKLHAMKDQGSPQFQTAVEDTIGTVEEHFKHAIHLSRQLEDREDRPASATAGTTTTNGSRRAASAEPESQDRPEAPREEKQENQEKADDRQNE